MAYSPEESLRKAQSQARVALNRHVKCLTNSKRRQDWSDSKDRLDAAYDWVLKTEQALTERNRRTVEAAGGYTDW